MRTQLVALFAATINEMHQHLTERLTKLEAFVVYAANNDCEHEMRLRARAALCGLDYATTDPAKINEAYAAWLEAE